MTEQRGHGFGGMYIRHHDDCTNERSTLSARSLYIHGLSELQPSLHYDTMMTWIKVLHENGSGI